MNKKTLDMDAGKDNCYFKSWLLFHLAVACLASHAVSPPLLLCNQILVEYLNVSMSWKQNNTIIN